MRLSYVETFSSWGKQVVVCVREGVLSVGVRIGRPVIVIMIMLVQY